MFPSTLEPPQIPAGRCPGLGRGLVRQQIPAPVTPPGRHATGQVTELETTHSSDTSPSQSWKRTFAKIEVSQTLRRFVLSSNCDSYQEPRSEVHLLGAGVPRLPARVPARGLLQLLQLDRHLQAGLYRAAAVWPGN